jgi:hypothetical protein
VFVLSTGRDRSIDRWYPNVYPLRTRSIDGLTD